MVLTPVDISFPYTSSHSVSERPPLCQSTSSHLSSANPKSALSGSSSQLCSDWPYAMSPLGRQWGHNLASIPSFVFSVRCLHVLFPSLNHAYIVTCLGSPIGDSRGDWNTFREGTLEGRCVGKQKEIGPPFRVLVVISDSCCACPCMVRAGLWGGHLCAQDYARMQTFWHLHI